MDAASHQLCYTITASANLPDREREFVFQIKTYIRRNADKTCLFDFLPLASPPFLAVVNIGKHL
jgi:hypothetical protein